MKRWSFVSGLTVILLLLLVLSGFSVVVIRDLTEDLDQLIARNYDSIRAMRELRAGTTRLNVHYRSVQDSEEIPESRVLFDHERSLILDRAAFLVTQSPDEPRRSQAALLQAYVKEYLIAYDEFLAFAGRKLTRSTADDFESSSIKVAQLTGSIADACTALIDSNEREIFERRDNAVARGRRVTWVTLGIAGFSLLIYIIASMRLAHGIYQPLRELRDAINRVQNRRFDEPIHVDGSEELDQIVTSFNQMAAELRAYLLEQDERVLSANRLSRSILEALPKPVYIVNERFEVVLMNPRAAKLSDAVGVPGGLPSVVMQKLDHAAANGVDVVGDDLRHAIEIEWADAGCGSKRFAYIPQVFRMRNELGEPGGWAVLLMNVTNLRQIDAAKSKAISTLGHEVKTPVTGIRMTLHLLLEEKLGQLNADQRELIEAGRADCERLLAVLQSLLELARLESGRTAFKLEPTPVENLLMQAEAMHGMLLANSGHPLRVEPVDPSLAPVAADVMHAGRVLGNYLANAAKYSTAGTEVVMRAVSRADGYVRFSVINQVERMLSEAEQARLFEPFFRRSGENAEGAGLGLTIAREIAQAHSGRVGVWCGENKVEFFLDLPAVRSFS